MNKTNKTCLTCGCTSQEFLETGFLGCADCFVNLADAVTPVLSSMFGTSVHVGKSLIEAEGEYTRQERVAMLEAELRVAVREERYQEAANIKIQIDKLNEEGGL